MKLYLVSYFLVNSESPEPDTSSFIEIRSSILRSFEKRFGFPFVSANMIKISLMLIFKTFSFIVFIFSVIVYSLVA